MLLLLLLLLMLLLLLLLLQRTAVINLMLLVRLRRPIRDCGTFQRGLKQGEGNKSESSTTKGDKPERLGLATRPLPLG
jgi:hypothetical protein